jgi:hypothetical protein
MRCVKSLLLSCALLLMIGYAVSPVLAAEAATAVGQGVSEQALGHCDAFADCDDGSFVSCTGSSSCTFFDSACPLERGYVECDGVRTYCPICPFVECPLNGKKCGTDADCRRLLPECQSCVCAHLQESSTEQQPVPVGSCLCPL